MSLPCRRGRARGFANRGASAMSETKALEYKTREEWLDGRKSLITASDAAAALGLSPFKSALKLYAEKIGLAEDGEEREAMKWGKALQGAIGSRFAEVSGRAVTEAPPFTIFLHPDHPRVGCTLDFFEQDGEKGRGALETKATGIPWKDEPPLFYQVQLQLQVAIIGVVYGTLASFQGLYKPPIWADMEANPTFVKRALGKLDEFLWRLDNRKPPEVGDVAPDSTAEALKLLYPKETVEGVALPPEALGVAAEVKKLKAAKKEMEDQLKARENAIKAWLGDAELGYLTDGSAFQWRVEPRSGYTVGPSEPRVLRHLKGKT